MNTKCLRSTLNTQAVIALTDGRKIDLSERPFIYTGKYPEDGWYFVSVWLSESKQMIHDVPCSTSEIMWSGNRN